jgi:cystathionine beta-lyase
MTYDFDQPVNRVRTSSLKWDFIKRQGRMVFWDETDTSRHERPVLPLWVADMDFPCPQEVVEAVTARAAEGIYGYVYPTSSYYEAVIDWFRRRQSWTVSPEWFCHTPGVVPALHMLVGTFVGPGVESVSSA